MNKIIAFLHDLRRKIEFRPSVEHVLAGFTRTVDRLERIAAHHDACSERKGELIADLQYEIDAHDDDSVRARITADNIRGLLGAHQ